MSSVSSGHTGHDTKSMNHEKNKIGGHSSHFSSISSKLNVNENLLDLKYLYLEYLEYCIILYVHFFHFSG